MIMWAPEVCKVADHHFLKDGDEGEACPRFHSNKSQHVRSEHPLKVRSDWSPHCAAEAGCHSATGSMLHCEPAGSAQTQQATVCFTARS